MLQALSGEHRVTLLAWEVPRLDVVNRHDGTTLAPGAFEVSVVPRIADRLARLAPVGAALYRSLFLMRLARRAAAAYDLTITADNEADLGPPGIQYIHFPRFVQERPQRDLRWYSRARLARRVYYGLGSRV